MESSFPESRIKNPENANCNLELLVTIFFLGVMDLNLLQDPPLGLNMPSINISFPRATSTSSVQGLKIKICWDDERDKWCVTHDFSNDYGSHTFWGYYDDLAIALEEISDQLCNLSTFDSNRD